MVFYTQYVRPEKKYMETHIDEGKVERLGYMETADIVNQFMMAGESLRMFRGGEYGPDEEIPIDAPAMRYMDEQDAILAMREHNRGVEARIARANAEAEALAKEQLASGQDGISETVTDGK